MYRLVQSIRAWDNRMTTRDAVFEGNLYRHHASIRCNFGLDHSSFTRYLSNNWNGRSHYLKKLCEMTKFRLSAS